MRAVQLTAYGNPVEPLKYVDIPAPEAPGPNQVLIGVELSPDRRAAAQRVSQSEIGRMGGAERRQFRCRAVGDRVREKARPEDRQHRPAAGAPARA